MSTCIVFLLPPRQTKGTNFDPGTSIPVTNTGTNGSTRIRLNSYSGVSNGHVSSDDSYMAGDNPAYIAVE